MRCNNGYKQPEKITHWTMFWQVVSYYCSEFQVFRSLNGLHVLFSFKFVPWSCSKPGMILFTHFWPQQTKTNWRRFASLPLVNQVRFPHKSWLIAGFPLCFVDEIFWLRSSVVIQKLTIMLAGLIRAVLSIYFQEKFHKTWFIVLLSKNEQVLINPNQVEKAWQQIMWRITFVGKDRFKQKLRKPSCTRTYFSQWFMKLSGVKILYTGSHPRTYVHKRWSAFF